MRAVADRPARPAGVSPTFVIALLALACPGAAYPALPPAAPDASTQRANSGATPVAGAATQPDNTQESNWVLPDVQWGGSVSYDLRRDTSDAQKRMQQGLSSTLNARANTFIWQPWFARVNGSLGLTLSRTGSSGGSGNDAFGTPNNDSSQNVILTGSGQLLLVPKSHFPFEAHFERTNNRVSSDLALANGYASQRYGFTQRYFRPDGGNAMFGWDRSTQTSDATGTDRQDSLQLNLSKSLENHRLQLRGYNTRNTRDISGENTLQSNLTLQHGYAPDPSLSVENLANINRSGYQLRQGDNRTRLLQLSSLAFWRPADQALTVNGSARVLALEAETTGYAMNGSAYGASVRNANANVGVNYDINRFTRINAGANLNLMENNGEKSTSTHQTLGASYQPEAIALGSFQYNWSSSGSVNNQTGAQNSGRQMELQLSHDLARSFKLQGGSSIGVQGSQSLSTILRSGALSGEEAAATQRLIHSGSLTWNLSQESGATQMRLSASDSRALGGRQEFFQLVNFQASSNLSTSRYNSWTGNLTIQAVRQSTYTFFDNADPLSPQWSTASGKSLTTTSSGSISYQNQRAFGVPRLRFVSDLRLNSQALLPLLGSARDQETAAWGNRLDYAIGRTQLRVNVLIARSGGQQSRFDPATGATSMENAKKINKSIMFSIIRNFGDF